MEILEIYEKSCLIIGNIIMPICLLLLIGNAILFVWHLIQILIEKIK